MRQPLARMVCVAPGVAGVGARSRSSRCSPRSSTSSEWISRPPRDELVTLEAKPNFRALGKKFGKQTPLAAQAVAALSSEQLRALRARRAAGH